MKPLAAMFAISILLWGSLGAPAGAAADAAIPQRTVDVSLAAVLPPAGEVEPALALEILAALREEAAARGWRLAGESEIGVAMAGRAGPGVSTANLVEIGRRLGAGTVVSCELADLGGEIEIRLRALSTVDGPSGMHLHVATRGTAAAEARRGLAAALAAAPPPAMVPVPPPPPPPPPAPPPPAPPPVQVLTLPPGYVIVAPGMTSPPAAAPPQEPLPRRVRREPTEEELRRADGRRVPRVFGITAGVQAGALYLTLMAIWSQYQLELSPYQWRATAIVFCAVSPAISGLGAWGYANRSRLTTVSYPAIIGGTYVGSAVNLALVLTTFESRGDHWILSWVMAPILLPALGATVAYLVGREDRQEVAAGRASRSLAGGRIEWSAPAPTIVPATDGSRRMNPGLSLGTLTF